MEAGVFVVVFPEKVGVGKVVGRFALEVGDDVGGLDVEEAVGTALGEVPVVEVGLEDFVRGGVDDFVSFGDALEKLGVLAVDCFGGLSGGLF